MSCKLNKNRMAALERGTLPPSELGLLKEHAQGCPHCSSELKLLALLAADSKRVWTPEVPAGLAQAIMASVNAEALVEPDESWWASLLGVPLGWRLAASSLGLALVVMAGLLGADLAGAGANASNRSIDGAPAQNAASQGQNPTGSEQVPASDWASSFEAESEDLPLGWVITASNSDSPGDSSTLRDGALRDGGRHQAAGEEI